MVKDKKLCILFLDHEQVLSVECKVVDLPVLVS
jgi:hypothetical protein